MRRVKLKSLVLAAALACAGCAHYVLQVPEPNPTGKSWEKTYVVYFWGLLETEKIASECDVTQAMDMVLVKDNLAYDLVAVLTLGIVQPIAIEYKCSAGKAEVGPPIGGP